MCSASEASSLPGSGILMRPTLMRPNQDQIQAPVQPRQRRAEPEKGFPVPCSVFSFLTRALPVTLLKSDQKNSRAPNGAYNFQANMINS